MATRSLNSLSNLPPEVPLSYLLDDALVRQLQPEGSELTGVTSSASTAQKRGRGRPPKPKPNFRQNGRFPTNLNILPEEGPEAKRPRGRPRKDGTPVMSQDAPMVGEVAPAKRRGRPSGRKGRGRPRKSKPVSSLERVSPIIVVNGPRKRGRPRKYDLGAAAFPASLENGEAMAAAPAKRRGRPPKIGGVISVSRSGRPRGRPRKDATPAAVQVSGEETADYGSLKRKYEFLQVKVKEATNKLKAAVSAMEEVKVIAAAMNAE